MLKRKLSPAESPLPVPMSPSLGGIRSYAKKPRQVLYAQFDESELDERPLLDLLNLRLSTTAHHAVSVRNTEATADPQFTGAFVYFCPSAQTDHIWRSMVVAHFFQRRFGSVFYMRACPKPTKRIREEDLDVDEFLKNLEKVGGFGSPQALDSCVIVPVAGNSPSNLLFRGSAIVSALGLVNEPLYYREGWLPWQDFYDQDAHKSHAVMKVERVNGETCLYKLQGINWKRAEL